MITFPGLSSKARRLVSLSVAVTLSSGGLLVVASPASAATCAITFEGTTLSDTLQLQTAMNNAGSGACSAAGDTVTVTFTAGLAVGATPLSWNYDSDLVLQGGSTLTGDGSNRVLDVGSNPGKVTIDGLTVTGGGEADYGAAVYSDGADLTISNAVFSGNHLTGSGAYGGAVGSDRGAELVVTNSTFSGNGTSNDDGGAIYWEGNVTISNSTFASNVARVGGALWHSSGTLLITNSTFSDNSIGSSSGGAIYSALTSVLNVSSSTFLRNSADDFGGAIYNVGSATISDSLFNLNVSKDNYSGSFEKGGGAISHDSGTLTVTGSTFTTNDTLDFDGGAIFSDSAGVLDISTSTFSGNSADDRAGAIFARGAVAVSDSTFTGNDAGYQGGAIFAVDALDVTGSSFLNNSGYDGGAISAWNSARFTVTTSLFNGNSGRNGGAIDTYSGRSVQIESSTFSNNTATGNGGAVYLVEASSVLNSTITGNAAVAGGGIFFASEAAYELNFVTMVDNSPTNLFSSDSDTNPTVNGSLFAQSGSDLNCGDTTWNAGQVSDSIISPVSDSSCGIEFTSASWADVSLGSLTDNGGPTPTMMPSQSSILVDAVTDPTVTALTSLDQRGYARSGAYTAGAVQWGASGPDTDLSNMPPPWYQAYQRSSSEEVCAQGWDPSWAEWPGEGSGGWTCERTILWDSSLGRWIEVSGFH